MASNKNLGAIGIGIGVAFWFLEAAIHAFIFYHGSFITELLPPDPHEIWMRSLVVVLIVAFGFYSAYQANKILEQEKEVERIKIFGSTMHATHHILNNLLNQLQLVRIEAESSHDFDKQILKSFDNSLRQAEELVKKLSNIDHITEESILSSVKPTSGS